MSSSHACIKYKEISSPEDPGSKFTIFLNLFINTRLSKFLILLVRLDNNHSRSTFGRGFNRKILNLEVRIFLSL